MSRGENQSPTVYIKISTTPQVKACLEELVPKGIYGKTIPEVAERLISEKIRQLIGDGEIRRR